MVLIFEFCLVCKECIYSKIEDEELECCPVCNIDLGTDPFTKMRQVFHKLSCCSYCTMLFSWHDFMLLNMHDWSQVSLIGNYIII